MIALLAAGVIALSQGQPPSTAAIHGRVVDKDSGRPLVHALVRLSGLDESAVSLSTITDERGSFVFDALPPGRYDGFVMARQHAFGTIGGANGIRLAADQIVEVTVTVPRTYAINVRVVDAFGDPLSGVSIDAFALDTGRTPGPLSMSGSDDLGRIRLFDLQPGRYRLCASGSSLGLSPGTSSLRAERLVRTCYPSADEANAEPVRLGQADLDGIEIRMRRGPTFTITGTIVDAAGTTVPSARATLSRFHENGGSGTSLTVDATGAFTVRNAQPGTYVIQATVGGTGERFNEHHDAEAFVEVDVTAADVDVLVALKPTVDVVGAVTLEDSGATLPAPLGSGVMIDSRLADDRQPGMASRHYAMMRPDRTFTLENMFGRRLLDVSNAPRGWYLKSVRYDGREIIDTPTEFKGGAGAPALELVLSTRGAVVTGTVVADDGTPVPSAVVGLLRAGADGRLHVVTTRRVTGGRFSLGPARGGEYVVVALAATSEILPTAPQDRLQRLAALGERLTLSDLDERSVQLHVVRER